MGSYAELYFDNFNISSFKSHLPFEPLLMFVRDDLVISEEKDDDGETRKTYEFRTTVSQAKHRLDSRGLDLATCRLLFDELRSDELLHFEPDSYESMYIPNPIDFETYLQVLKRIFYEKKERSLPLGLGHPHEWEDDLEAKMISEEGFFHDEAEVYFSDVTYCVFFRSFLEIVPSQSTVVLNFTELVHAGWIDEEFLPTIFDHYMKLVLRRIQLDYKLYGFVIEDDPSIDKRLRERVVSLDENQFISNVLHPLLQRMGYERIRQITFHGPGEFGSDILPFRYKTPLGTLEYYAVQAKAVDIHGTSSKSGNAAELISQATQAFAVSFVDDIDNERKHIDKFVIATNKGITADARRFIEEAVEGKRKLVFLDLDHIIALVKQYRLLQYLLFSDLK